MLPTLRPAARPLFRAVNPNARSFVSTVLLSKSWDNETAADLRKELKKRGLTSSGNKATLIGRLSEYDEHQQRDALASPPVQIRKVSSTSQPADIPGLPNIPPPPPNARTNYLATVLPDLTPRPVIESAPIPFVPDFWDSSKVKAEEQPEPAESNDPKIIVVAGATTHIRGGPSHNLYHEPESTSSDISPEASLFKAEGFLYDLFTESGLPTTVKVPSANFESQDAPRTDSAATGGGWTLIGLLFGSWVVAGVVAPKSKIEGEAHHH